jgi:hypothetical protein
MIRTHKLAGGMTLQKLWYNCAINKKKFMKKKILDIRNVVVQNIKTKIQKFSIAKGSYFLIIQKFSQINKFQKGYNIAQSLKLQKKFEHYILPNHKIKNNNSAFFKLSIITKVLYKFKYLKKKVLFSFLVFILMGYIYNHIVAVDESFLNINQILERINKVYKYLIEEGLINDTNWCNKFLKFFVSLLKKLIVYLLYLLHLIYHFFHKFWAILIWLLGWFFRKLLEILISFLEKIVNICLSMWFGDIVVLLIFLLRKLLQFLKLKIFSLRVGLETNYMEKYIKLAKKSLYIPSIDNERFHLLKLENRLTIFSEIIIRLLKKRQFVLLPSLVYKVLQIIINAKKNNESIGYLIDYLLKYFILFYKKKAENVIQLIKEIKQKTSVDKIKKLFFSIIEFISIFLILYYNIKYIFNPSKILLNIMLLKKSIEEALKALINYLIIADIAFITKYFQTSKMLFLFKKKKVAIADNINPTDNINGNYRKYPKNPKFPDKPRPRITPENVIPPKDNIPAQKNIRPRKNKNKNKKK